MLLSTDVANALHAHLASRHCLPADAHGQPLSPAGLYDLLGLAEAGLPEPRSVLGHCAAAAYGLAPCRGATLTVAAALLALLAELDAVHPDHSLWADGCAHRLWRNMDQVIGRAVWAAGLAVDGAGD